MELKQEIGTVEESFRASLQDILIVAQKLAPHCKSVEDLASLCQVALENDAQLRLLISIIKSTKR